MGVRGKSHLRRRRDARLDVAEAIRLRLEGFSYGDLAATLGVAKSTVQSALAPIRSVLDPTALEHRRRKKLVNRALKAALMALSK